MGEQDRKKSIYIWNTDITQIPCFRESYLCGICVGLLSGLVTFMATSKPRLAGHYATGTFAAVTMIYWFPCRYNYRRQKFMMAQIEAAAFQAAVMEGTGEFDQIPVDRSPLVDV